MSEAVELEVGELGAATFRLDPGRVGAYLDLLGEQPRGHVPMGFSFIWFLHALIDALGGLNDASAVLLGHDIEFGTQPVPADHLRTSVSIAEVDVDDRRRRVTFAMQTVRGEDLVARDAMTVLWPNPDGGAAVEASAGKRDSSKQELEPPAGPALLTGRISQEQIDRYADVSDDHNPLHVDVEGAKNGPFGTTIAHGPIPLGYALRVHERASATDWLPGLALSTRFRAPARPGDTVSVFPWTSPEGADGHVVANQRGRILITSAPRPTQR